MDPQTFINILAPYAMDNMRRFHILASITIAQGALESGWGSFAKGNNLFGIKGTGQLFETREYMNNHWISVKDGFRVYDSWEGSVLDHLEFLLQNSRYAKVVGEVDYLQAANALQRAGYATDPQYAEKLIRIIEDYGLVRFDQLVWAGEAAGVQSLLDAEDANKIIAFLAAAWSATEVADARQEFHRLADELRRVSGQPAGG